jgi:LuxR family maltose regulon positive regulatory protein
MPADGSAAPGLLLRDVTSPRPGRPELPAGTIARTRLLRRLQALADVQVVGVCAPAGYGKTTLLTQFAAEDPRPCAWLSLTPAHDDPVSLLTDVTRALDGTEDVDGDVLDALRGGPAAVIPIALPRLGRALSARAKPFVLVLDDAQHLASARSVDVLRLLIDQLPPGSQLLLGSRAEPAFPTSRLRVDRRLALLTVQDLEMTPAEGTELLRAAGVELGREEAEVVVRQTEGWAAALYLASLALRDDDGTGETLLTGHDRPLTDYFREEVLAQAEPAQVAFLTRTSMLRVLTAPLCDAVLERKDSAAMLQTLADANLFVLPLDAEQGSYRVHQLFAENLAEELHRSEPALEAGLHRRASDWYAVADDTEPAIWHARQSGDLARAADLMWFATPWLVGNGMVATYLRWAAWFEPEQVVANPAVGIGAAWCSVESGHASEAGDWLALAAAAPGDTVLVDGSPLEAQIALVRSALSLDGMAQSLRYAERARGLLPPEQPWRCLAQFFAGCGHHLMGERELAVAELDEAERRSSVVFPSVHVIALAQQAIMATEDERWEKAGGLVERIRRQQRAHGLEDYTSGAHVAAVIALVEAQRGEASLARASARRAATTLATHRQVAPWTAAMARLMLARVHLALGDAVAARTVLAEAQADLHRVPDATLLQEQAQATDAQISAVGIAVPGGPSSLTSAEVRVLQYLPTHMSVREIGDQLFISRHTVKSHCMAIYRKLDTSGRSEAVERARTLGILEFTRAQQQQT